MIGSADVSKRQRLEEPNPEKRVCQRVLSKVGEHLVVKVENGEICYESVKH